MFKTNKSSSISSYIDRWLLLATIGLAVFGFFMILSAEMGESTADINVLSSATLKQVLNLVLGLAFLFIFTYKGHFFTNLRKTFYDGLYWFMLISLLVPRLFAPVGGAYAWIRIFNFSIQPSEFAKLFIIIYSSKVFAKDEPTKNAIILKSYIIKLLIYVIIIVFVQKDLGSAVVLGIIGYVCALVAPYASIRKIQNWMIIGILFFFVLVFIGLSSIGTSFLEHFADDYKVLRFLSSANPFNYQYGSGYHLVMSLVTMAAGGLTGVGYGKSIHKFMNFPNPSTDFILPVIIEELGLLFGFGSVIVGYGIILVRLGVHAKRCQYARGKIVITGTFIYFLVHFIFNVGGVSGLIPLTGVPLLLISSGGSSLMACMGAIGFSLSEIINYRRRLNIDENNSRKV